MENKLLRSYFNQEVRIYNLFGFRLKYESSYFFGESHGCRGNHRVFGKQSLDVFDESVRRINGVQPIGDATELGIKFKGMYVPVCNPRHRCLSRQYRHNRETAVPDASMVSTLVSQYSDACQPTAQNEMLRQSEVLCHQIFRSIVRKVSVEFRNGAKCQDLKRFPGWWEFWSVVFIEMFRYEVFLRPLDLSTDMDDVGLKAFGIFTQSLIRKPERAVVSREIANHLATCGDFYLEDGVEDELLQFGVEAIDGNDITEMGVGFKDMGLSVNFHRTPIVCQTEITRPVKDGRCLSLIFNNKPPLFQSLNLLDEGKGLLGIVHIKNEVPACCTPRERTCAGIYWVQSYDF